MKKGNNSELLKYDYCFSWSQKYSYFEKCPFYWYADSLNPDRVKVAKGIQYYYGSAVHEGLEALNKRRFAHETYTVAEIVDAVEKFWFAHIDNEHRALIDADDETVLEAITDTRDMVAAYIDQPRVAPAMTPEHHIVIPLRNPVTRECVMNFGVQGFMDKIADGLQHRWLVVDFKTSKDRYSQAKTDADGQFSDYSYLLDEDIDAQHDVLVKRKQLTSSVRDFIFHTNDTERVLKDRYMSYLQYRAMAATLLGAGYITRRDKGSYWMCKTCDRRRECEAFESGELVVCDNLSLITGAWREKVTKHGEEDGLG